MSRLLILLFVTAGIGLAACAAPQANTSQAAAKSMAPISKDDYDAGIRNAQTQAKMENEACATRTGNAKDICLAEAAGREKVAKAEAEAQYKNTPKARQDARGARAEANYTVAKEKCDNLAGNTKDVCVKEADAALIKAKADAKVDRVAADASQSATAKEADARQHAVADTRDADYKVAVEKCDALSGPVKSACVSDAKLRYVK